MKGYIHIYCGDGKGKTTASVGLAVRAAGRGKNVLVSRFLKTEDSGEVAVLRTIPGITVLPCERTFGFTFQMTPEQKREAAGYYKNQLEQTWKQAISGGYDVLILDEIMAVCNTGLVDETRLLFLLDHKPEHLEVIMTGRNPSEECKARADYISEIKKEKHPFDFGVSAREGIEY